MNARNLRGFLTINNIVEACQENPELVFEQIQDVIDNANKDIPDEAASIENILLLQHLQSYYSNQYSFLVGLWGVLRFEAKRTDPHLIAMRDYLEKAVSACKNKYDAASRMLTGYQEIRSDTRGARNL